MDHGDLLRECRHLLHAILSQISILVAGLQRVEGQQRHPQPPLPAAAPAVPPVPAMPDALPPLPPPLTPAPTSPKAPATRTSFTSMPITLRERNRRRRSRRRDTRRHRSRSRSRHRRPLNLFGHLEVCPGVNRHSESDARMAARPPRNSRHGLRPLDTSSTWYVPELSPPRDERRDVPGAGAEHEPRPGGTPRTDLAAQLPPPRVTAPITMHANRGPVTTPTSTPDSDSDHSIRPHRGASSFRSSPTVVHGPRELLQEFTTALRNAYHEPFTAWMHGELDEMVRRKKDKGARPTYKTIARFLHKNTDEVKHAWKVYQRLEARN